MSTFKDFYVYVLMDNKEKEVFYVGRGKNGNNQITTKKEPLNVEKQERIEAIHKDPDNDLVPLTVGRFDTEEEAKAVEGMLVHWVYGFDNLTNGKVGDYFEQVRSKNDFRVLQGIDVPED